MGNTGGQPATQGAPEEEMASFQSVDGTTRLELIARYLEEMESLWIDFEIALQDMCERLKAESNTADGVYKQVVYLLQHCRRRCHQEDAAC